MKGKVERERGGLSVNETTAKLLLSALGNAATCPRHEPLQCIVFVQFKVLIIIKKSGKQEAEETDVNERC